MVNSFQRLFAILCILSLAAVPAIAQEESTAVEAEQSNVNQIMLSEDGSLIGHVFVQDEDVKNPVEAKVSLTRDGVIIDSVLADELGTFSFASVAPGTYNMFASADNMVASQPIDVMPYDGGGFAAPMEMGMTGDFGGGYDGMYDSYSAMPADTFSMAGSSCGGSCGGGFGGGGGGGGGRGFGGGGRIPGWIGLVGLVGLAGDGDDDATADD